MDSADTILQLEGVSCYFGGLAAVSELDLAVERGYIHGLIGPNGAGKTTVFNIITGANPATGGCVRFEGHDVTTLPSWAVNRLGIARTFQNIRLFPTIDVLDNVRTAGAWRTGYGWWDGLWQGRKFESGERAIRRAAMELLDEFGLAHRARESARSLPYGEQRRLEIVRALATQPRMLLLDEPAAGLNPAETDALMGLVYRIRDERGLTVLLIEHDMRLVMSICQRITVLDHGVRISEGSSGEVRDDPAVIAAYLGEEVPGSASGH
jgi:branched-chain amino acid transport system ATP-binding protein